MHLLERGLPTCIIVMKAWGFYLFLSCFGRSLPSSATEDLFWEYSAEISSELSRLPVSCKLVMLVCRSGLNKDYTTKFILRLSSV